MNLCMVATRQPRTVPVVNLYMAALASSRPRGVESFMSWIGKSQELNWQELKVSCDELVRVRVLQGVGDRRELWGWVVANLERETFKDCEGEYFPAHTVLQPSFVKDFLECPVRG